MDRDKVERLIREAFRAGFDISREGFNGEHQNDALAPDDLSVFDDPRKAAESATVEKLLPAASVKD